jgi:hypothetical protein
MSANGLLILLQLKNESFQSLYSIYNQRFAESTSVPAIGMAPLSALVASSIVLRGLWRRSAGSFEECIDLALL